MVSLQSVTHVPRVLPAPRRAGTALVLAAATAAAFVEPISRAVRRHDDGFTVGALAVVASCALALAVAGAPRRERAPDIHDRQLDYILGGALAVTVLVLLVLAGAPSAPAFKHYPDLLALPLWTAACIAVACGTRAMWHARAPLAMLLLLWPPLTAVGAHLARLLGAPLVSLTHRVSESGAGPARAAAAVPPSAGGGEIVLAAALVALTVLGVHRRRSRAAVTGLWRRAGAVLAAAGVAVVLDAGRLLLVGSDGSASRAETDVSVAVTFAAWLALATVIALAVRSGRGTVQHAASRPVSTRKPVPRVRLAVGVVAVAALACAGVNGWVGVTTVLQPGPHSSVAQGARP